MCRQINYTDIYYCDMYLCINKSTTRAAKENIQALGPP